MRCCCSFSFHEVCLFIYFSIVMFVNSPKVKEMIWQTLWNTLFLPHIQFLFRHPSSLCQWFLKMFTMNGVQYSEDPLLFGQFLFLQPQEPLWVFVVNISEYQSDLSLTMKLNYTWIHFTFLLSHYQTKIFLFYCILSPLSNSKTVFQDKAKLKRQKLDALLIFMFI